MKKTIALLCVLVIVLSGCSNTGSIPENAKIFYRTIITYAGENESEERHLELSMKSEALLKKLMSEKNAFVMDAYNYQPIDEKGTHLYKENELGGVPIEISPNGYSIRISENYLKYNPIQLADNEQWDNKIIYDDTTLNVLVPIEYQNKESVITEKYKEIFYYEKIKVANFYNEDLGKPLDTTSIDELSVNIIYVADNQTYFTYNPDICPESDNLITNPLVMLYTGNIHASYAHSFMSQFTFFESHAEDAYKDIEPLIIECNAAESYQKVYSIYE